MLNTVMRYTPSLSKANKGMKIPTEKTNRVMCYEKKEYENKRRQGLERKSDGSNGVAIL